MGYGCKMTSRFSQDLYGGAISKVSFGVSTTNPFRIRKYVSPFALHLQRGVISCFAKLLLRVFRREQLKYCDKTLFWGKCTCQYAHLGPLSQPLACVHDELETARPSSAGSAKSILPSGYKRLHFSSNDPGDDQHKLNSTTAERFIVFSI